MSDQPSWMPSDETLRATAHNCTLYANCYQLDPMEDLRALLATAVERALAEQEARWISTLKAVYRDERCHPDFAELWAKAERSPDYWAELLDLSASAYRKQEARHRRLLPMARFGMKCFDEHRDQLGDLDGSDLQEWAESFGLLREVHVTEPCGDSCRCVEWDDFPQECLRETDEVAALRAELAALDKEAKGE